MAYAELLLKQFTLDGIIYTYEDLRNFETIKTYAESSHFDRILKRDIKNNKLFLYEFYELVDYSGGDDQIYTTFVLVKDEDDADLLNKERDIRRNPYVRMMPNCEIEIH